MGGGGGVQVGGGGLGVRVDVNEELNFFVKIKKKIIFFLGGGVGLGGSGWWGGWVMLKAMLGVGGDVGYGYGGCEPRVEGIVQGTKRYSTILRKFPKKSLGGGGGSGWGSEWM